MARKPVDHTGFRVRKEGETDPSKTTSTGSGQRRWWTLDAKQAAQAIGGTIENLRDQQTSRMTQYTMNARLYGTPTITPIVGMGLRMTPLASPFRDVVSENVTQSAIDTFVSKMATNRPRRMFLTNGGDASQQHRAQRLNKFVDGVFYENDHTSRRLQAIKDGAIWGDGIIHVYDRDGRVAWERVLPHEILVDEVEGVFGEPRQMHRLKWIDREVLLELFPDKAEQINRAHEAPSSETVHAQVSDLILVRESWHLPSIPGAKDGKHLLSLADSALTDMEDWPYDYFPFARWRWCTRPYGYWSQGLCEQVMSRQIDLNKVDWLIRRSHDLGGSFKILVENGAKVADSHLTRDVGAIIHYTGVKPEYVVPPHLPNDVYQYRLELIRSIYNLAGISQLSAASEKPAGLDSGKAIREFHDIGSERFRASQKEDELFTLELAKIAVAGVRQIMKNKGEKGATYEVKAPGMRSVELVNWKDAELDEQDYVLQCFPVSSLPSDPAGRLQTVQEYAQAGYLSPRKARRLLDLPDLDAEEALANAAEDKILQDLDRIVIDGVNVMPDPLDDLKQAVELAIQYYHRGVVQNLSPDRLDLLRIYIQQVADLMKASEPPPPPEAMTGAPAMAEPPLRSDLIPNAVNQPPAAA